MIDTIRYLRRTIEHTNRVQTRGLELLDKVELNKLDKHKFLLNLSKHDQSKFQGIQLSAYPAMFNNSDDPTETEKKAFDNAWKDHYTKETHHLIGVDCKVNPGRIISYEIACDLQAMSDEFGDSALEYFNNKWKESNKPHVSDLEVWCAICHNIEIALSRFK